MGVFSWLAAQFSRTQVLQHVDVVDPPALYFQHVNIGGRTTPEEVSSILRECDTGYMYRFVDLFNECRQKDCHLQSVLGTRECAVANMRWEVIPASERRKDKKIADWTTEWLTNFGTSMPRDGEEEVKDFRYLVSHLGSDVTFGYALAETLFERDGGYVIPVGCQPIHHRRFIYELTRGRLQFWDMFGQLPYPGVDLMAAYPGRFVMSLPRVNGDTQSREGLARVLVWAAIFRRWAVSDWLKLAELAWKPWRIGTYKKGAGKEDINALREAMQRLTTDGVTWLPDTTAMEVAWVKNRGEAGHGNLSAFLSAEMSKAVLGATLTVEQGRVGSQALGNVHDEVRHDIRDGDAANRVAALRRTLIRPAVQLNFGKDAACPGLRFFAEKSVDPVQVSIAVMNLSKAGLAMPAAWVRDQIGIPDPKPGEEIVQLPPPALPVANEPEKPNGKPAPESDQPPAADGEADDDKKAA